MRTTSFILLFACLCVCFVATAHAKRFRSTINDGELRGVRREGRERRSNGGLMYPDGSRIQLNKCMGGPHQQWNIANPDKTIRLLTDGKCLDISGYGTGDGSIIWLYSCHTNDPDPSHQNQEWIWNNTNQTIVSTLSQRCIDAHSYQAPFAPITTWACTSSPSQKWHFNSTDSTIRHLESGLCLDAASPAPRPCDVAPGNTLPFCNSSLPLATRVKDLVSRIPDADKVAMFGNGAGGSPSLNIPPYQWWSEALHGVAGSPGVNFANPTPYATSFPQVCLTGASFDKTLWSNIGSTISTEARAFANAGNAGLTFWAPNLNIFRDPRWGRGQETVGEDPYLTSLYVKNFVRGLQDGEDPNYLKVSSCCKHYAAYSLEDWEGMDRYHFNAVVNKQDLFDTYFPAFQSCISPESAGASGIMCSYNAVNGVPSCADDYLLTDLARNTWKFDGYITGDCGAVDCVQNSHHYTSNPDQTCKAVLNAGTDIDCGDFLPNNLQHAISSGVVNMSLVDRALTNLFSVQMRLGIFDPVAKQPYMQIPTSLINTPAAQLLAEQAALEGIVLLQNNNKALPLTPPLKGYVAAIGPHAMATTAMQGNYYGNAPYLISPVAGLSQYYNVKYSMGSAITGTNTSGFADACANAKTAAATILFIGINQDIEAEGRDRTNITLPGVQEQLVAEVASCSAGPVIVVVLSGGALDLTNIKNNPKVSSIMWVGYPGQSGGNATAKVISGDVSPSGRLSYTMYTNSYVNQVSFEDMNMRPNSTTKSPGRTYRFFTGQPLYTFGYGLSYTNFGYKWSSPAASLSTATIQSLITNPNYSPFTAKPVLNTTVIVSNFGGVNSDVTVLVYMSGPRAGSNGYPIKELVGFERVHALASGASAQVTIPILPHNLGFVDTNGNLGTMGGAWTLTIQDCTACSNVVTLS